MRDSLAPEKIGSLICSIKKKGGDTWNYPFQEEIFSITESFLSSKAGGQQFSGGKRRKEAWIRKKMRGQGHKTTSRRHTGIPVKVSVQPPHRQLNKITPRWVCKTAGFENRRATALFVIWKGQIPTQDSSGNTGKSLTNNVQINMAGFIKTPENLE